MMKSFLVLFLLIFPFLKASGEDILINEIEVNCKLPDFCEKYEEKYSYLKDRTVSQVDLINELKFSLLDDSIKKFSFKILRTQNGNLLKIEVSQKRIVGGIKFSSPYELKFGDIKKYLPFKEGQFFENKNIDESYKAITKYLNDRGFGENSIELKIDPFENQINLEFQINIGRLYKVKTVRTLDKNLKVIKEFQTKFFNLNGEIVNQLKFKIQVDQFSQDLFNQGYFFRRVKILDKVKIEGTDLVELRLQVILGDRFNFYFRGNKIFSRQELFDKIKAEIKGNLGEFTKSDLEELLLKYYKEKGIFNSKINSYTKKGITKDGVKFKNFYFNIKEGLKILLEKIQFEGNKVLTPNYLLATYEEHGTVLSTRGFVDLDYLKTFRAIIEKEYLKKGFVFVEISEPKITYSKQSSTAEVFYKIKERGQTILEKINFDGFPQETLEELKSKLVNKVGMPLNVISIQSDLNNSLAFIRNRGFYFARIINLNKKDIISYNSNFSKSVLNLKLDLGKKAILKNILVTGNTKTRYKVINRELHLKKGEAVTPKKLDGIRERLSYLGLFSFIKITPFITNKEENSDEYEINLLINVKEKDSINLVVAPGYRTDIGLKLSTELRFSNFGGMDRELNIKAQANQRLNFSNLDKRRRDDEKRLIEYTLKTTFIEPYFLGKKIGFDASISTTRKRFRGFDADILRLSSSVAKTFFNFLTTSIRYQLEIINQFDATDEDKDKNFFRIGSLIPSIQLDFRDSAIKPTKGVFFGLSWEFANPFFYSMDNQDLSINFNKLVLRNKFYYPFSKNLVFALSMSGGVETNFASDYKKDQNGAFVLDNDGNLERKGFIPSIKVFRLDGVDIVRGFKDSEINQLDNGEDISEVVVDERAYFTNIKFESRYFLDDSIILAHFFDAGRLFVNSYRPTDLRASTGLSFKLLTPVGSLDFDYGVKFRRRKDQVGNRETFGRFHLSIGFF